MEESSFTPGPWQIVFHHTVHYEGGGRCRDYCGKGLPVRVVPVTEEDCKENAGRPTYLRYELPENKHIELQYDNVDAIVSADGKEVASIGGGYDGRGYVGTPDALLIAAAPDLFNACVEVLEWLKLGPKHGPHIRLLEGVIQKATDLQRTTNVQESGKL